MSKNAILLVKHQNVELISMIISCPQLQIIHLKLGSLHKVLLYFYYYYYYVPLVDSRKFLLFTSEVHGSSTSRSTKEPYVRNRAMKYSEN